MHDPHALRLRPLPPRPVVTVITMCKDRAWCIERCIQSVLAQDYPAIEYILQDGASRDGTLDVLKKYEGRVQVHSERDRGPMDAFHKALAKSTGHVFCILLSDETFHDTHVVSRVIEAFHQYPDSGAIYGDFRTVDARYRPIRVEKKEQLTFEQIFCQDDFISPCAAFVRTETLKDNGRPNADLRSYFDVIGDFGLWVYVGARFPLKYVPGVMADFMVHGDEASYELKHCQAYIRECETTIQVFESGAYTPKELVALKRRALAKLYLNYGNQLAGRYSGEPLRLAWKGIRTRPRLILSRTFLGVLIRAAGLQWLLRVRGHAGSPRRASVL